MNVAFPAVVLLVILLPGLVFVRKSSSAGIFRLPRSFSDELLKGSAFAGVAHFAWVLIADAMSPLTGLRVSLPSVIYFLTGHYGEKDSKLNGAVNALCEHPIAVVVYFFSLFGASWLIAALWKSRCESTYEKVDLFKDEPNARVFAEWEGLLKIPNDGEVWLVLASIVELGGEAFLYEGRVGNVWSDITGHPDRFELWGVRRRKINENDDSFVAVPGKGFVLRLHEMKTINLRYFSVALEDDDVEVTESVTNDSLSKEPKD